MGNEGLLTIRSLAVAIVVGALLSLSGCIRLVGKYHYEAGERLYFAGNYSEAIKGFDGAIKHKFQLRESYAMRGLCHYEKGEYDLAIADNNEALRISPNYDAAYNGRGVAYYRKGEIDKSISDMEQVLKYTNDKSLREAAAKLLRVLKDEQ